MSAVPLNGQTWLICGGRNFSDQAMFDDAMSELLSHMGCPSWILQGGANGADLLAINWAVRMAVPYRTIYADWGKHGKAAGPIRNQEMLDRYKPQVVVAFPGGSGTLDMVRRAHMARAAEGKPDVIEVKPK